MHTETKTELWKYQFVWKKSKAGNSPSLNVCTHYYFHAELTVSHPEGAVSSTLIVLIQGLWSPGLKCSANTNFHAVFSNLWISRVSKMSEQISEEFIRPQLEGKKWGIWSFCFSSAGFCESECAQRIWWVGRDLISTTRVYYSRSWGMLAFLYLMKLLSSCWIWFHFWWL